MVKSDADLVLIVVYPINDNNNDISNGRSRNNYNNLLLVGIVDAVYSLRMDADDGLASGDE